jgi:hydroxymethylpyrimidine/phosphomethylpyrimidine kinase
MLATSAIVEAVAAAVDELDCPPSCWIRSSRRPAGRACSIRTVFNRSVSNSCPGARVVTPNIPEAEALSGLRIRRHRIAGGQPSGSTTWAQAAVIITGGHADGEEVVDLLFDGETFVELRTDRVKECRVHGTGCAFASAVTARWPTADHSRTRREAQRYVAGRHCACPDSGRGAALLDHFWNARPRPGNGGLPQVCGSDFSRTHGPVY